jgi:hypothetical protein
VLVRYNVEGDQALTGGSRSLRRLSDYPHRRPVHVRAAVPAEKASSNGSAATAKGDLGSVRG